MLQIIQGDNRKSHHLQQFHKNASLSEMNITNLCSIIIKNGREKNIEIFTRNINLLSETLLISSDQLVKKYQESTDSLKSYAMNKFEIYKNVLTESREYYDEIRALYQETTIRNIKVLVPLNEDSDKNHCRRLTDHKLRKTVLKSFLAISRDELKGREGINIPSNKSSWNLLVIKEKNIVRIVKWSGCIQVYENNPDFLGKGTFGIVQKVYDITLAQFSALKIAYSSNDKMKSYSVLTLLNEVSKLRIIHKNDVCIGLQFPPYALYKKPFYGYLQPYYSEGDLLSYILKDMHNPDNISVEDGLMIFNEIMLGIKQLHSNKDGKEIVIHGDIKIDNVFVHINSKNETHFYIGDFGGTIIPKLEVNIKDESSLVNSPFGTIASKSYFTFGDCEKLKGAVDKGNLNKWINYQKRRDLYAAGVTIWGVLTGVMPYMMYMFSPFPDTNKIPDGAYIKKKYGNTISSCLLKMLSEDPKKRPSAKEVCKIIENELRKLKNDAERGADLRVDE